MTNYIKLHYIHYIHKIENYTIATCRRNLYEIHSPTLLYDYPINLGSKYGGNMIELHLLQKIGYIQQLTCTYFKR